ncbi:MAG TPA: hydrogenase maturation protease [Candidatus Wallbacteria bacterium]|nr:hydrogenase maturation protease [Candidatus Wallbacteria bacterium]
MNEKTNVKTLDGIFASINETVGKSSKIVFMGIGNFNRCDDAIGAHIISSVVESRLDAENYSNSLKFASADHSKQIMVISAATTPENFVDDIIDFKPETIFYIDCANFDDALAAPGEARLFYEDSLAHSKAAISTHSMSINLLIEIFKHKIPAAQNIFVGIKPESIEYDYSPDYIKNITPSVLACGEKIIEYFKTVILRNMEAV